MLKAVLFDMDGVIVDTEPLHRKAYFLMFKDMDIAVTEAMYTSYTGQSTINICNHLIGHFNLDSAPQTLVSIKNKHFKYSKISNRSGCIHQSSSDDPSR